MWRITSFGKSLGQSSGTSSGECVCNVLYSSTSIAIVLKKLHLVALHFVFPSTTAMGVNTTDTLFSLRQTSNADSIRQDIIARTPLTDRQQVICHLYSVDAADNHVKSVIR